MLLHPAVPPMIRPQPPLSALHYFAPENEEERKLRLELGFGRTEDAADPEDGVMDDVVVPESSVPRTTEPVANLATTISAQPPQSTTESALANKTHSIEASQISSTPKVPGITTNAVSEVMDLDTEPVSKTLAPKSELPPQEPFISLGDKGKSPAMPEPIAARMQPAAAPDDDDEPIPELDSGSSIGFASDDEDED